MSLKTWKEEYYPIAASDVKKKDALQHSLRKWIGLQPENRRKHCVCLTDTYDLAEGRNADADKTLCIDASSCALCVHHYDGQIGVDSTCKTCPLRKARGVPCDQWLSNESSPSPWSQFANDGATKPMLQLLRKAAAMVRKAKAKRKAKR